MLRWRLGNTLGAKAGGAPASCGRRRGLQAWSLARASQPPLQKEKERLGRGKRPSHRREPYQGGVCAGPVLGRVPEATGPEREAGLWQRIEGWGLRAPGSSGSGLLCPQPCLLPELSSWEPGPGSTDGLKMGCGGAGSPGVPRPGRPAEPCHLLIWAPGLLRCQGSGADRCCHHHRGDEGTRGRVLAPQPAALQGLAPLSRLFLPCPGASGGTGGWKPLWLFSRHLTYPNCSLFLDWPLPPHIHQVPVLGSRLSSGNCSVCFALSCEVLGDLREHRPPGPRPRLPQNLPELEKTLRGGHQLCLPPPGCGVPRGGQAQPQVAGHHHRKASFQMRKPRFREDIAGGSAAATLR